MAKTPPRHQKPPPLYRSLRVYTFDPGIATKVDTAPINQTVLRVPWEEGLQPGPVGDYLEVIDYDPASDCFYDPVDLNDTYLLAQDGLAPSEGNPQFHQQMVYAVAMTTIANFERALGRRVLWAPHIERDKETREFIRAEPVFRLRIYPHALREQNAYYSPEKRFIRNERARGLKKVDMLTPLGVVSTDSRTGGQHVHQLVVPCLRHSRL
jgi:hypothetical protein